MTKREKQKELNQDYPDYRVENEAAKAQVKVLGDFIKWQPATGRIGIRIPSRSER